MHANTQSPWYAPPEARKALLHGLLVLGMALTMLGLSEIGGPTAADANDEGHDVTAIRRDATFMINDRVGGGSAEHVYAYGRASDQALLCDWNGTGTRTAGVRRGNTWMLRNTHAGGGADVVFNYGRSGDMPICGDWNGNGTETVGIVRHEASGPVFHLRNSNSGGAAHVSAHYGSAGDQPVVGDWNGNGTTTIGVARGDGSLRWLLRNSNSGGPANHDYRYARAGDIPVVGDWNHDGTTTVGAVRDAQWMLRNVHAGGPADRVFKYGRAGDTFLVGRRVPPPPDPEGTIAGRVMDVHETQAGDVDHEDAEPIDQATVTVYDDGAPVASTQTGVDGTYQVDVAPGTYDVEATHEDYAEAFGWLATDVTVQDGQTTTVDFGLYPEATEPTESTQTNSTSDDVDPRDDWWLVLARDDQDDPLDADDDTPIVYVTPTGHAVWLGNAGTGAWSWWERPSDDWQYADGVHSLYYQIDGTWWNLDVGFDDGELVSVNGDLYVEEEEQFSAQQHDADGDGGDTPDAPQDGGVVVPGS